jgi:hypothetical protein
MTNPACESNSKALRLDFDRRLMLHFRNSAITADAGLLPKCNDAFSRFTRVTGCAMLGPWLRQYV